MRHSIFIWYFFVLVQGQNQEPPCQAPDSNNNWVYTSSSANPNYAGTPGVWYYLSNQKADIYSFDQYCKSLNSNMAKIFTQKENDFLTDLLINSHNAWLAGHMVVQNNTFENWYWFNNADANNDGNEPDSQLIEYFNWDQGQPITKNGKSWITINGDKKDGQTPGKWTARTPDNVNYFLCESRCPDTNNDPEPGTVLFEYGNSKNFTSDSDGIISCRGCDPIGQIDYLPKNYRIEVIGAFLNNNDTQPTLKPSQYFIPLQIGSLYIPNEGVTRNDAKTLPDIYIYRGSLYFHPNHTENDS